MRLAMVAGEASGDLLGAGLLRALKQRDPELQADGIAGPGMIEAGCHALYPAEKLSVFGIVDALRHYRELSAIRNQLFEHFAREKPDVFVGIDAPDFNIDLARRLREIGIRTVQYVSPSVWAWRRYRVRKIAQAEDLVLSLFPFEAEFYRAHQVPVEFVGHPLADMIPMQADRDAARAGLDLSGESPIIAMLPGSRMSEVRYLGPVFIQTARWCLERRDDLRFVVPFASSKVRAAFEALLAAQGADLPLTLMDGQSREVMAASDAVLLSAGTATLEAMLMKRPMVVAYRFNRINYWILKRLVKTAHASLPNLLAGERLVPEFIQQEARPETLGAALLANLDDKERVSYLNKRFTDIHEQLRLGTDARAAEAVLRLAAEKRDAA